MAEQGIHRYLINYFIFIKIYLNNGNETFKLDARFLYD